MTTDKQRQTLGKETRRGAELDNLTMDSLAAERAGQSYGKWKTTHPNTYTERDARGEFKKKAEPPRFNPLVCPCCGVTFTPNHPKQKYCSELCRDRENGRRYRAKKGGTQ